MRAADRPEFGEIPAEVKARVERSIRLQSFEILHGEAVQRGDIGPPPATRFDKLQGLILKILFSLLLGLLLGMVAVVLTLFLVRSLATVI